MKLIHNLKSAVFLLGLLTAAGLAMMLDGLHRQVAYAFTANLDHTDTTIGFSGPQKLDINDMIAARIAWDYIENNTQPETGMVNSVDGFPSSTLWDQGSYLFALVSARKIGLITETDFDDRVVRFVDGMSKLELIDAALPNKVYNTQTLLMTDYEDKLRPDGIGWSALDITRILLGLRVLEKYAPKHGDQIRRTVANWDFDAMTQLGELIGTSRVDGEMVELQEGRIGYEQYGARAAALWGLDVLQAISANRILGWREIEGVDVPIDLRSSARFGTINPTLSEPYILMALELGLDAESAVLAKRVYQAQEARYLDTDIYTFVSEDHLDAAPHFTYASVFSNARDWAVVDANGRHFPDMRTHSTKASFAWDVLFDTEYTNHGRARVKHLAVEGRGWYAGVYEKTGQENKSLSLNTNAVILEALHYKQFGPLWMLQNKFVEPTQQDLERIRPVARGDI